MHGNDRSHASSGFSIGKIISEKRKKLGFSQAHMSHLMEKQGVKISQRMISNYENDHPGSPDVDTVIAFGIVLGIDDLVNLYFPNIVKTSPSDFSNPVDEVKKDEEIPIEKLNDTGKYKCNESESDEHVHSLTSSELNKPEMLNRILGIMEQQNANMKLIAQVAKDATAASLNTTATNGRLAAIIERFLGGELEGRPETSNTYVKKTDD